MDIWELMFNKIQLTPPISMGTLFSGIGTQEMALKRITSDYEIKFCCEIDKYALKSYDAIHGDIPNLGNVCDVDTIPYVDILTYSFPCTDLSKAGKQAGMNDGTRSNLVYEVIRILKNTTNKPKVLIMENVPDLIQAKFSRQFHEIQNEIEALGYMNYVETLNAKNYGVAQNRDRVFMVSILGEYSYEFPKWVVLEKRLKDYLEPVVDEKYYLSDKMFNYISSRMPNGKNKMTTGINISNKKNGNIAGTICTSGGNQPTDNFIIENEDIIYDKKIGNIVKVIGNVNPSGRGMNGQVYGGNLAPTITTNKGEGVKILTDETICLNSQVNGKQPSLQDRIYDSEGISTAITTSFMPSIMIPEATKQGYALAKDGVYLNRPHQKRGCVQDGMIQTIKTSGDDVGVVTDSLRIRKLTPLECWRLMGISDQDFHQAEQVVSNSQLYKQAGNAIVVDVFEAILRNMIRKEEYENIIESQEINRTITD